MNHTESAVTGYDITAELFKTHFHLFSPEVDKQSFGVHLMMIKELLDSVSQSRVIFSLLFPELLLYSETFAALITNYKIL